MNQKWRWWGQLFDSFQGGFQSAVARTSNPGNAGHGLIWND
jgi:hypothetical protein